MAPSPKTFSFLFLLTLFSIQVLARDVHFFSKIPATTNIPINQNLEPIIPNKLEDEIFHNDEKLQEPTFIKDTENNYGLYSTNNRDFTPLNNNDDNNNPPFKAQTQLTKQETYTSYPNTNTNTNTNNNFYYKNEDNNDAYAVKRQPNLGETSLRANSFASNDDNYLPYGSKSRESYPNNPNTNTNIFDNNNNNGYNDKQLEDFIDKSLDQSSYTNNKADQTQFFNYNKDINNNNNWEYYDNNNVKKQGMSDTRYMDNGVYFYDVNNPNSMNYNNKYRQNQFGNSRVDNTRMGYYNNNNNNENSNYENKNSVERYPNNYQEQKFEGSTSVLGHNN